MRILLTSPMGNPADPKTWSAAPSNLARALGEHGIEVVPFNSSGNFTKPLKAVAAAMNMARGLPTRDISRFDVMRAIRGRAVRAAAEASRVDHILCTSTIDTPRDCQIPYSVWVDDTVNLLQKTPMSPGFGARSLAVVDALDGAAFARAANVFPFSAHVADNIVDHYGIARTKVTAVGCGSGPIPMFHGQKNYAHGGLLFVAKHQFAEKGGELLLAAWPEIVARRPQTKLTLIGSKDAVTRAAGIPGVTALDYVPWDDLVANFHGAAMLVQPMLSDPWGQVYLEAMKSRTIVVSLNHRALPELTKNGELGFLLDAATPAQLAETVLAAYATPDHKLAEMADKAQMHVQDHHEWNAVAKRMIARIAQ